MSVLQACEASGAPNPRVSVVVPNYNHGRFLRQRIESIFAQTFQDFELILLDDASTDDSAKILREYASDARARRAGVRLEINDANSGTPFAQWNKGVRMARGEYVWVAESDDYANPRFLERLFPVLRADPQIAFTYCRSLRADASGDADGFGDWYLELVDAERWVADFCVDGRTGFLAYLASCCVVANASAVLFRKNFYDATGGADEALRLCGDWKVWAGMALAGRVAFVSEALNYYRVHAGGAFQQGMRDATAVLESLAVAQWILRRTDLSEGDLARAYSLQATGWVPALMSLRVPVRQKREILRGVREFDPHPARRVLKPACKTIQLKLRRHWGKLRSAARSGKAPAKSLRSAAKGSCS